MPEDLNQCLPFVLCALFLTLTFAAGTVLWIAGSSLTQYFGITFRLIWGWGEASGAVCRGRPIIQPTNSKGELGRRRRNWSAITMWQESWKSCSTI